MIVTPIANGIEIIIFLFIIGSSIVSKLIQANQQPKGQRGPKGPPREKTDVEREIEAFLRGTVRAKENDEAGAAQGDAAQRPPQLPPQRPVGGTARRGASVAPRKPAEIEAARQAFPRGESVVEHVDRHIVDHGVSEYDPPLGDDVGQSDERFEAQLHKSFDHTLGSLRKSDIDTDEIAEGTDDDAWAYREAAVPGSDTAKRVRELLSNPQDVASAFVLSEILKPVDPEQE